MSTLRRFAQISWNVNDLDDIEEWEDLSVEEKEAILEKYEQLIVDATIQAGWDALANLAVFENERDQ